MARNVKNINDMSIEELTPMLQNLNTEIEKLDKDRTPLVERRDAIRAILREKLSTINEVAGTLRGVPRGTIIDKFEGDAISGKDAEVEILKFLSDGEKKKITGNERTAWRLRQSTFNVVKKKLKDSNLINWENGGPRNTVYWITAAGKKYLTKK